jgi:hypothetical protein
MLTIYWLYMSMTEVAGMGQHMGQGAAPALNLGMYRIATIQTHVSRVPRGIMVDDGFKKSRPSEGCLRLQCIGIFTQESV